MASRQIVYHSNEIKEGIQVRSIGFIKFDAEGILLNELVKLKIMLMLKGLKTHTHKKKIKMTCVL